MSLETIKNRIHQKINELVVTATLDEMAGDIPAYKEKLEIIARVAEALGIDAEITEITINLKN